MHVGRVLGSRVSVLLPDEGDNLRAVFESQGVGPIVAIERGVAQAVWRTHRNAGCGASAFSESQGLYLPLIGSKGAVGVLGIFPDDPQRFEDPSQFYLLDAFASQTAAAVERGELAGEATRRKAEVETERLRNSLLSSVSHDLRTPLAVITGSASTLLGDDRVVSPTERRSLLQGIFDEAERLNRLIGNLLDMTRIESGAIQLKKEWYPIEEVIGVARARTRRHPHGPRPAGERQRRPDGPPRWSSVEQALVNVLENAAKYTAPQTSIDIDAHLEGSSLAIAIADCGPGLPSGCEERVFEKFYRGGNGAAPGAGLGLAIARGVAVAHGGQLTAKNREGGGAVLPSPFPSRESRLTLRPQTRR